MKIDEEKIDIIIQNNKSSKKETIEEILNKQSIKKNYLQLKKIIIMNLKIQIKMITLLIIVFQLLI